MTRFIKPDEMTPLERMTAFSKGQPIDRVPCCPFTGESFAPYFGHSIAKFNHSTDVIVDTIVKTFELFRPDNCSIGPGLQGLPEAMGSKLAFPENSTPLVVSPAISDLRDVSQLKIVDPYRDGRLRYYLEAMKIVQRRLEGQVAVGNTVGGPFTTAAFLLGTERFLKELAQNPEGIHQLMEIATESTLRFIDAVLDLGISPGIADPIASCTLISPRMYREFVKPYTTRCQDRIIERAGSGSVMHICGRSKGIWGDMVDTGITALSLDNCDDIGQLREAYGDKVAVVGNVDPVGVIMQGTTEEIHEAVRICVEKAAGSPKGFILASGCDIPIGTDPQKIHDFINGTRLHGRQDGSIPHLKRTRAGC